MNFLKKIYRFFFPKNFMQELKRGIELGNKPGVTLGGALFDLGKKTRKAIDPEHKLNLDKKKKK